jgi:hypothetical protein
MPAMLEPKPQADGLPVFVANGRRRFRAVRLGKIVLALALAGWLAALSASLIGFAPLPLPALTGADEEHPVAAVRPQSSGDPHAGLATSRDARAGSSGRGSLTAGRGEGKTPKRGSGATSIPGDTSAPAGTQPSTTGDAQTSSDSTSSSSTAGSSSQTSTTASPAPAPAPAPAPPPTTAPTASDPTSSPDQPSSTTSPDGASSTISPPTQGSTTSPDSSSSGSLPAG